MIYISTYLSPLGNILLAADDIGLTGLWFEGQKYFANTLPDKRIVQETKILTEAKKWLDIYFSGEAPHLLPLFILPDPHSDRQYGRFYYRFLMGRRSHMERLHEE